MPDQGGAGPDNTEPVGAQPTASAEEGPGERIRVVRSVSPLTRRPIYALWNGNQPILAANNYLRAQIHLAESSLKTTAYNLLPWFRFLDRNGLLDPAESTGRSFWTLEVRSANSRVAGLFRNSLDALRRSNAITDRTAQKYLEAAFLLCRWWRQDGEPEFGTVTTAPSRGVFSHTRREKFADVPAVWRLRPRKDLPTPPPKTLSQEALESVWSFLTDDCRPERPEILRSKPRADWSEQRRRAYTVARDSYDYQRSLYCRNLAVWGALEATGARLSELPLLTLDDVIAQDGNDRKLFLRFMLREDTRHLGSLKSGGGESYIGWNVRAVDALMTWLDQREIIVARAAALGIPAHPIPMLFTNHDGRPLTSGAITHLFRRLRKWTDTRYGSPIEPMASTTPGLPVRRRAVRSSMYPHLLRHTLTTVMRSGCVSTEVQKRQLRHGSLASQDDYGSIYDEAYIASLDAMVVRNAERASTRPALLRGTSLTQGGDAC